MAWDVTVATTLADSYLPASSVTAAAAAEAAASRKEAKYADLPASISSQLLWKRWGQLTTQPLISCES